MTPGEARGHRSLRKLGFADCSRPGSLLGVLELPTRPGLQCPPCSAGQVQPPS